MRLWLTIFFAALLLCQSSHAQGFVNLNFESAHTSGYPPHDNVQTGDAIPGWAASFFITGIGNVYPSEIWQNAISLGGGGISINDTNTGFSFAPLAGKYSVFLFGGNYVSGEFFPESATISQSGLVPVGSQSIQMRIGNYGGMGIFAVALNGQQISMIPLAVFPTYTLFGGNVSPFANQTAALSITALKVTSGPGPNPVLLDNIQFSSAPIPEPSALALAALGCGLFGFRHWRKISKT
jgi:PEP-CTERM motif